MRRRKEEENKECKIKKKTKNVGTHEEGAGVTRKRLMGMMKERGGGREGRREGSTGRGERRGGDERGREGTRGQGDEEQADVTVVAHMTSGINSRLVGGWAADRNRPGGGRGRRYKKWSL